MYVRIKRNDEKIYLLYFNSNKKKYEKRQYGKLLSFVIQLFFALRILLTRVSPFYYNPILK